MEKMIYDYNVFTEIKCSTCSKIERKDDIVWARERSSARDGWQMASNLSFHYVCCNACAEVLKEMLDRYKEEKKKNKGNKNANN